MGEHFERPQLYWYRWNWFYLLIIGAAASLVFYWRIQIFGDLEPRSDQAFLAWWVKGLVNSNHIFPHIDQGERLIDALARDETGFLTQLLRPIYNSPTELFKIIPILAYYGTAQFFGDSYSNQVAMSIFTSAAIPFILALFPIYYKSFGVHLSRFLIGLIALFIASTSVYLHFFSGWGIHNSGILTLVIAVIVSSGILSKLGKNNARWIPWRYVIGLFLINGLALYSFKTNLFLLPPATVFALFALPGVKWQQKFTLVFCYTLIVAVLILPIIPLTLISANKPEFAQDMTSPITLMLADLPTNPLNWLIIIYERSLSWFTTAQKLYSLPGLTLGIIGLVILARDGIKLPFYLMLAHYLSWCFVPIFAGVAFRTYPYLIPFLILGGAYFLVISCHRTVLRGFNKKIFFSIACVLLIAHISTQILMLRPKTSLANTLPDFWSMYFAGQGEIRPIIAEIEHSLPAQATLLTWGYGLKFLYRNLKTTDQDVELPAINALMLRQRAGLLSAHIRKRRLSI
jgi:hypothetical protein